MCGSYFRSRARFQGNRVLGRCSVHVGCCVLQVGVDMECEDEIAREYRGVNEDAPIEYTS